MTESMHLKDVTFHRRDIDEYGTGTVVWVDHSGDLPLPAPDGRGELGALLIQVGVDGIYTVIHHQDGDRAVLAKVIEDLTFLLKRLDGVYPDDEPRGRCLMFGDWGRCWSDHGHGDDHRFPNEEDWNRANPPRNPVNVPA